MGRFTSRIGVSAVVVAMTGGVASAGVFQTIALDGDLGEWDGGALFYANADIGDASNPDAGYNAVYVANDNDNLYIGIRTDGPNGGTIGNDWMHTLYLDTDGNAATGANNGWMTHGYDFIVQYGASSSTYSAFEWNGGAWDFRGLINYSFSGDVVEWGVPRSLLDDPASMVMEFHVGGGSAGGETWAYMFENGARTYTMAVPEPASMLLLAAGGLALIGRRR